MNRETNDLLRALISVSGRTAFPRDELMKLIAPKKGMEKQIKAFNLCDGSRTQAEVAKSLKLDSSNFSGTVSRWIEAGILFRLGEGREARLLHVYRLTEGE
jgi:hypothetical protein